MWHIARLAAVTAVIQWERAGAAHGAAHVAERVGQPMATRRLSHCASARFFFVASETAASKLTIPVVG